MLFLYLLFATGLHAIHSFVRHHDTVPCLSANVQMAWRTIIIIVLRVIHVEIWCIDRQHVGQ